MIGRRYIKLFSKNHYIIAIDKIIKNKIDSKEVKYIQIDLTKSKQLKKINKIKKKFDAIIHLAAILGVKNTEKNELKCLDENLTATKNLLNFCVQKKIKKFLFASSSEVYGDGYKDFIKESYQVMPKSVYGVSKVACEEYLKAYSKKYKFSFNILRFFNVYGEDQKKFFVIPIFVNSVKQNKGIKLFGSGNQIRSFCYVDDAVKGLNKVLIKGRKNQIYNIGNNLEPIKILDLAKKIKKIANSNIKISKVPFKKSDRSELREIFFRKPLVKKIKKDTGFTPKVSLEKGIKFFFKC